MNVAAGPELAAAVTNAGGLGVIGGVGYTPNVLRQQVGSPHLLPPACRSILVCLAELQMQCIDHGLEKGPKGPKRAIRR
jgi:hypothetical protein